MRIMLGRSDTSLRRAWSAPAPGAAQVFTQGFLNASLLQLAICSPPRQAATTRRYSEIYITELGEKVRQKQFVRDERQEAAV
jgi:hypothetical protein